MSKKKAETSFWTNPISATAEFAKDSRQLINRCSKPSRREYIRIVTSCALGFAVMGFIGFFVKLLFIPINNILLAAPSSS
jgi:protein transport protein SEC61 subunit gamma-like protein